MDDSSETPRGAQGRAVPLPSKARIAEAIQALHSGARLQESGAPHPMGERGEAAQYLGVLKALVAQIEYGLKGGPLHPGVLSGQIAGYGDETTWLIAADAFDAEVKATMAGQRSQQVPHADFHLAVAALGFHVAENSLKAAAEISVGLQDSAYAPDHAAEFTASMIHTVEALAEFVAERKEKPGKSS
ncbi:hypothetical protein ACFWPV_09895 [Streptomyces uncialis]|uniref:hypothetical protein n=1 Tax=Streptomyces uncialis TaxID=1048205 RepID=UPI003669DFAF